MSTIYLLTHACDEGGVEVRGAFTTEEAAQKSLETVNADGKPTRSWFAHHDHCCSVEAVEVLTEPVIDVREDDPPIDPNSAAGGLFAGVAEIMEEMLRQALEPASPYRRLTDIVTAQPIVRPDPTAPGPHYQD